MSLFMVGGEGPIEKGPMSWILLFMFLEVVPKTYLQGFEFLVSWKEKCFYLILLYCVDGDDDGPDTV